MAHNQSTGIGLRQVRIAQRDDDGAIKILGAVATGTAYPGVRVNKARALSITPAEPQRINARGDDVTYYTFQEAPTESPTGELRTQQSDIDVIEIVTGVKDFGSGNATMVPLSTDKLGQEEPLVVWGSRKAVDDETGNRVWETYILLNATAFARPQGFEVDQIGEFTWSLVCNASDQDQYGRDMTVDTHGATQAAYILVKTRYKFFLDAFEGDASETQFQLSNGANVLHDTATSPLFYFVNGVAVTGSCDAEGLVTLTAAPALGAKVIISGEYDD